MRFNNILFKGNLSLTRSLKKFVLSGFLVAACNLQANAQYCTPTYDNGCSFQDDLNGFTLTGQGASTISDLNTACGPNNGYEDRTSVIPPVDLMQGGSYSGTVSTSYAFGGEYVKIWIDFNNNNAFDLSEDLTGNLGSFDAATPQAFTLNIPLTAPVGTHRMRARVVFSPSGSIDPCNNESFGETHDYLVNILPAPPCAGQPTITGVTPAGPITSCAGAQQSLNMSIAVASGYTIQWQQSVNAGASWTNVGTASTNYTFTVAGTAWYRVYVTCNNSNLSDTSAHVVVNATPPVYASIPYFQDFETWTNYCDVLDIPGGTAVNWTNNPATGDESWRRDDQGGTANWNNQWGAYNPASISGQHSARFSTSSATSGNPGNLDLYLDCSQQTGDKAVYFYYINDNSFSGGDSLTVWLSTDGGSSFAQLGTYDSAFFWKKQVLPIASNSAQTLLRFQGKNLNFDFTDIGLDSVYVAAPCTGAPVAGMLIPAGPISDCPGKTFTFSTQGATTAGNLTYQWQQSLNGTTWTNIAGTGSISFTTPQLFDTIHYRLVVICNGSNLSDTTNEVTLNITAPTYAALPYVQGFETWSSFCDVLDVPSMNWLNTPATGDQSWRRDDQGATANWIGPTGGAYTPVSMEGSHSARFHTWFANWSSFGDLDLFVDCSVPGNKELQFYHINPSGTDELQIWLSTDGGSTFSMLQNWTSAANWTFRMVPIASTSTQTIIRFRGVSDFSDDIGIDDVKVLLPCAGTPTAGVVDSLAPCSGQNFVLTSTGTTLAAGITYQWQESLNGTTWVNSTNGNMASLNANITTPTWYRLIVNCTNSNIADTSAPRLLQLGAFYYCYCQSAATNTLDDDIGNFEVETYPSSTSVFTNGVASPLTNNPAAINTYTDFTNLGPVNLYKKDVYRFNITQINEQGFFPSSVAIYLDMNRDGIFDPIKEKIMQKVTSNTTNPPQQVNDTFRIPDTAKVGITGMRIVLVEGAFALPSPCIQYGFGETEDYLAYIDYPPCDGSTNPGTAMISDTILCPGFPFIVSDTSHEKYRSGLTWIWQSSTDNINWTDIPGTDSLDTIQQVSGSVPMFYRLKMNCSFSSSSTYSNSVHLALYPAYQCYCQSYADGGANDISDVGAFSIGNFIVNSGGPHLNNPVANKSYSAHGDNSDFVLLYTDSVYNLAAYHIMRSAAHQDAKVTLFIDYNNNFQYDVPEERVWTGFTSVANAFITSNVTIPNTAVKDVITGMRLIINNDTGPNVPSDEACGIYTSGETEDFPVMIKAKGSLGISGISSLSDFTLFPNPTTGKFSLRVNAGMTMGTLKVRVSTIAGQEVYSREFTPQSKHFITEIDLGDKASGVYLVEISDGNSQGIKKLMVK